MNIQVSENFKDEDVVFHLEVFDGYFDISNWFLENVRKAWPGSRVIVVSDGDKNPRYEEFRERYKAEVSYGEHLWGEGASGPLWERRFNAFLNGSGRWLLRMDSDAGVYRRLKRLPEGDCLFGTLFRLPGGRGFFAQGGAMGVTRGAAEKLMTSGALKSEKVANWNHLWRRQMMASDDRGIGEAARAVGIPTWNHPEFACSWKNRAANADLKYAIVHPCKNGKL